MHMKELIELIEKQMTRYSKHCAVQIPEENFIEVITDELSGFTGPFLNPIIDEVNKQGLLYSIAPQSDMRLKLMIFIATDVCAVRRNKGMVFYGPDRSGKTRKSMEIASKYDKEEVQLFTTRRSRHLFDNPFIFSECSQKTKLIIIDDVRDRYILELFLSFISGHEKITVNRMYEEKIEIDCPNIIIVCDSRMKLPFGERFTSSFDFYQFPNDSEITFSKLKF